MWAAEFHNGLRCWVVEDGRGYPLLEGEWEGSLHITNEQNALLIAAALNADEKGDTLTVVPMTVPMRDTGYAGAVVFPNEAEDKAADFGLSPMLAGARRMVFHSPSEEDVRAFLDREKANPTPEIAEYMAQESPPFPTYKPSEL